MAQLNQRKYKSPEEIAESVAKAKAILNKQKKQDGISSAKSGMIFIFIAAIYFGILAVLLFMKKELDLLYPMCLASILFFFMGISYLKNPYLISIVSSIMFLLFFVFLMIFNLDGGFKGVLFMTLKVIIFIGLVSGIRNAMKYKKELDEHNKHQRNDDLLDNELMDF